MTVRRHAYEPRSVRSRRSHYAFFVFFFLRRRAFFFVPFFLVAFFFAAFFFLLAAFLFLATVNSSIKGFGGHWPSSHNVDQTSPSDNYQLPSEVAIRYATIQLQLRVERSVRTRNRVKRDPFPVPLARSCTNLLYLCNTFWAKKVPGTKNFSRLGGGR